MEVRAIESSEGGNKGRFIRRKLIGLIYGLMAHRLIQMHRTMIGFLLPSPLSGASLFTLLLAIVPRFTFVKGPDLL